MTNKKNMNIELTRSEVCEVRLAIMGIIVDAEHELNYENPSEDRRKILIGTIEKWRTLRNKIIEQFNEQVAE